MIRRAILMHDFTPPRMDYIIAVTFDNEKAHKHFMRCYYSARKDCHADETLAQFTRNKSKPLPPPTLSLVQVLLIDELDLTVPYLKNHSGRCVVNTFAAVPPEQGTFTFSDNRGRSHAALALKVDGDRILYRKI